MTIRKVKQKTESVLSQQARRGNSCKSDEQIILNKQAHRIGKQEGVTRMDGNRGERKKAKEEEEKAEKEEELKVWRKR